MSEKNAVTYLRYLKKNNVNQGFFNNLIEV